MWLSEGIRMDKETFWFNIKISMFWNKLNGFFIWFVLKDYIKINLSKHKKSLKLLGNLCYENLEASNIIFD